MKGLLHSKKFRSNLYRWLFMYVGVILLLTTVITYSKYMSKSIKDDNARAAKFIINVSEENASTGKYRPTSNIEKNLSLDFSELEVTTDFQITLKLNDNFKYVDFKELTNTKLLSTCVGKENTNDTYYLCGKIPADFNNTIKYKVVVKYTGNTYEYTTNNKEVNIINVLWSGFQIP